ncbi:MAG TPA: hypothetical protein PK089_01680 [Methanoregulaceae archaeon]|nr:hypothetical protein [Methanoregulaceae archaeon]
MTRLISEAELGSKQLFLVLSPPDQLREQNLALTGELLAAGYRVCVITTNYPYRVLLRLYASAGLDLDRIDFIDAITPYALGAMPPPDSRCRFIQSPTDLTGIGIGVIELLAAHPGEQTCILIDSVSTMLIYLSPTSLSKFIHFVANRLRLLDHSGIFLAVERGLDPMLLTQLVTFVDATIEGQV